MQSTLQICQRGGWPGWVLYQVFPHLTTKCMLHYINANPITLLELTASY